MIELACFVGGLGIGVVIGVIVGARLTMHVYHLPNAGPAPEAIPVADLYDTDEAKPGDRYHLTGKTSEWFKTATGVEKDDYVDSGPRVKW